MNKTFTTEITYKEIAGNRISLKLSNNTIPQKPFSRNECLFFPNIKLDELKK